MGESREPKLSRGNGDEVYQLQLPDFNLVHASSSSTGTKLVLITEAEESYLRTKGIHLKPRNYRKECDICTEAFPSSSFLSTKGCAHEYCSQCCKRYAETKVMSRSTEIDCPEPTCNRSFDIDQCRSLLSKANFSALNLRLTEAAIPAALRMYCPFRDCSVLMEKSDSNGLFAVCYYCHRGFCQKCNVPWHSQQTCGEFRASEINSKLSGDQKFRDLAKYEKWQNCPECKQFVERTSGCKHMTCVCKNEFCYLCGKKYKNKSATCRC